MWLIFTPNPVSKPILCITLSPPCRSNCSYPFCLLLAINSKLRKLVTTVEVKFITGHITSGLIANKTLAESNHHFVMLLIINFINLIKCIRNLKSKIT